MMRLIRRAVIFSSLLKKNHNTNLRIFARVLDGGFRFLGLKVSHNQIVVPVMLLESSLGNVQKMLFNPTTTKE